MNDFFEELKRRNVVKVAIAYGVVAWAVIQFVDIVQNPFQLPDWFQRVVIVAFGIGFPIALLLSWAYEMTPDGVKKTADVDRSKSITPATGHRINKVIAGALVLALLFIGYDKFLAPGSTPVREAAAGQSSIAVLPFADLSQNQDQAYFADGISEEILNVLAQIPDLRVAGRTSSFSFKGHNEDLREIGDKLGVKFVLEGSVRKDNDKIRITAQLISASDGFHLWSNTYDRELTDIFAVQDEISNAVAEALEIQLGVGDKPGAQKAAVDPEAYNIYLRARQALHTRTGDGMEKARSFFETAVAIDPNISEAWSGLALTYNLFPYYADNGQDLNEKSKAAAEKALTLNPNNAEAYATLALDAFVDWDWQKAAIYNAKAEALAANDAEVTNFIGDYYRFTGDLINAIKWETRAYELDPLHEVQARDLGFAYLNANDFENALKYGAIAADLAPDNFYSADVKIQALAWSKKFKEASALIDAWENRPNANQDLILLDRATIASLGGNYEEADQYLKQYGVRVDNGRGSPALLAISYAINGDMDNAVLWFQRAYKEKDAALATEGYFLPDDYTSDPAVLAKFDLPVIKDMFDIRRANRKKYLDSLK